MFTNAASAYQLAASIATGLPPSANVEVALCPPYPYLSRVADAIRGTAIELGAQNFYPENEGAFTGEVSPIMLRDVGCKFAIVGHSERRHKLGETDSFINKKVHAGLAAGLKIILCVGETLNEREAGHLEMVVGTQLTAGLAGITAETLAHVTIAYEPVWAIGTGRNATPEQAQEAHAFIRNRIAALCGVPAAKSLLIQYGGSVKPDKVASLLSQADVDGALVGGASLQADLFLAIISHVPQNA